MNGTRTRAGTRAGTRACTGVIVAGGTATRMDGAPKGLAPVGGVRIIDRVAAALAGATDGLLVVANDAEATAWLPRVPVIPDARPGHGPLGGIHAALAHAGTDIIAVAWDLPFVPPGLLRALRDAGEARDAVAAAPASRSPWTFEPLATWYAAGALPIVATMLDEGEARMGALAARAAVLSVDVSSWGDPDALFFNVNTPDDLARANALAARGALHPGAPR